MAAKIHDKAGNIAILRIEFQGKTGARPGGGAAPGENMTMRRERPAGRNPDDDAARQAILAAARDCFTRKGYDGTTMREVAQAAGCDAAALKRHFKSKDRLFVRAMAGVVGPGSARGRSAGDTARMRLEYETRLALQESAYKEKLQEIEASLQEQVGNLERIIGALAKELRRAMQARNPRRR